MEQWQPIETAPPETLGEAIVVRRCADGRVFSTIAYYSPDYGDGDERGFWDPQTGDRIVHYYDDVTHWMPLPAPPA